MLSYEDIEVGDKWALKSNEKKVAEVTMVTRTGHFCGPRVEMRGDWFKAGYRNMMADTLEAHYTKVSTNPIFSGDERSEESDAKTC